MNKVFVYIVQATQIAYDIFGTLVIAVFLGILVDRTLGIKPIGILAGAGIGIIACFRNILKIGSK